VNFNYFISDEECEYILTALEQIAEHGWKLLPLYSVQARSGLHVHCRPVSSQLLALGDVLGRAGGGKGALRTVRSLGAAGPGDRGQLYRQHLKEAQHAYLNARALVEADIYRVRNWYSMSDALPMMEAKFRGIWWQPLDMVPELGLALPADHMLRMGLTRVDFVKLQGMAERWKTAVLERRAARAGPLSKEAAELESTVAEREMRRLQSAYRNPHGAN